MNAAITGFAVGGTCERGMADRAGAAAFFLGAAFGFGCPRFGLAVDASSCSLKSLEEGERSRFTPANAAAAGPTS